MDKFEDFIKNNTKFKESSTQEELNKIKSMNKGSSLNLKLLFATLSLASALFVALIALNPTEESKAPISDLAAEQYMVEVFLAVDEEISDTESDESEFL